MGDICVVTTDIGVHIMKYEADAALDDDTTEQIIGVILEQLQETAADTAYNEAMEQWHSEYAYDIAYSTLNIEKPRNATAETESATSGTGDSSAAG